MYRKGKARRNLSRRYQKAFYFVDNLRENVLRNVYSLDLNYDMELKIQGRANTSEVEVHGKTSSKCSSTKFVSYTLFL